MLHPLTSVTDLLALIGILLFAARGGPAHVRHVVLVLPGIWFAAGAAALALSADIGLVLPTLSVIAIGLLVAFAYIPSAMLIVVVSSLIGAVFGMANGIALVDTSAALASLAGTAAALFVGAALLGALFVRAQSGYGSMAMRVAGSWIAAIGFLLLGGVLRSSGLVAS
jgi:hydrogenase/urease accessory protein HupE